MQPSLRGAWLAVGWCDFWFFERQPYPHNGPLFPMDFEEQEGGDAVNPQELTSVSD